MEYQGKPKIKMFIWKACKNATPTRSNLYRRKLSDNHLCPVCQVATEDVERLLLTCPRTRPLWFVSSIQWNPADQNVARLYLWVHEKFNQLSTKNENYEQNDPLMLTLCWYIWKGWNLKLFEDQNLQPDSTLSLAINSASANLTELNRKTYLVPHDTNRAYIGCKSVWRPPPKGFPKANSDAIFDEAKNLCSIRVIMRDDQAVVLSGAARILPSLSHLHTKSLAMKEAHVLASNLGIKTIIFESDNQE